MGRRIDIELTRPQSLAYQLIQKPTTDVNLEWGRGSGKSWFDRLVAWLWVARADGKDRLDLLKELSFLDRLSPEQKRNAKSVRGVRIVFLMPTLKQFKGVHGSLLKSEIDNWAHLNPSPNWTDYRIEFPGGSWIAPFPAEQHSSQHARGIRADIVICDEADDIDPSVFDAIVRPWFSEPWSLKIRVTSGTYKRGRHGLLFKRRLAGQDPEQPRYHTIHATYRDSPEVVDQQEVEDAKRNTPPATFAREWECDPDAAEGLVYGGVWDEKFHVRIPPDDIIWSEFLIGGDKGYEDPGVLLLAAKIGHGADACLWVLDEFYQQHKTVDWWCDRLGAWAAETGCRKVYFDPSAADWKASFRAACGVSTPDVDNSIDEGVDAVANLMLVRQPGEDESQRYARLYIHPRCRNLIREINAYKRRQDPKDPERFLDDIVDKDNHAPDALRYIVSGHFGLKKTLGRP